MLMSKSTYRRSRGRWTHLSALVVVTALNGCSAGIAFRGDISAPPSSVLELSWAKAKWTNQGIVVWGQVQQVHCCAYVRGHIHLEARDQNGVIVVSTNARWGEFKARQLHSAWFKAVLPLPTEDGVSAIDIHFLAVK